MKRQHKAPQTHHEHGVQGWAVAAPAEADAPLVSLPATKPCPTTPQAGTSPTERGPTRLARAMKLTQRPGRAQDMKKLLEVRMGDARTLQNTTTSSTASGLELC